MSKLTISTIFLSDQWQITVTKDKDSVDLDLVHLVGGEATGEGTGACLPPEFAKELGAALMDAGYTIEPEDD